MGEGRETSAILSAIKIHFRKEKERGTLLGNCNTKSKGNRKGSIAHGNHAPQDCTFSSVMTEMAKEN